MISKLLNNRMFAICVCIAFAIALILAKQFDERNQADRFTTADLLVEPRVDQAEKAGTQDSISVGSLEESQFYANEGSSILEPLMLEEQADPHFRSKPEQELPPLVGLDMASDANDSVFDIEPIRAQGESVTESNSGFQRNQFVPESGTKQTSQDPAQWRNGSSSLAESDGQFEALPINQEQRPDSEFREPVEEETESESDFQSLPAQLPNATSKPPMNRVAAPKGNLEPPEPKPKSPEPKKPEPKSPKPKPPFQGSDSLNPTNFRLAEQPKIGGDFHPHDPVTDSRTWLVEPNQGDFHPGPIYDGLPYDPSAQMNVYEGKSLYATQRPLLELGRPWYQLGQLPEGFDFLGKHNHVSPQLLVFGDMRTAYASNNNVNESDSQIAFEWNMNWDLRLTSTERFAWFLAPVNKGESNTRFELDNDRYVDEWNADFLFGYFEGDLGAMVGGAIGETLPFDLPFAVGVMPLLFQNGIWLEDQFLGIAATIPARHSTRLGISNMDVTFFAGYDEILSPAFEFEDDVAKLYGIASFIEANNGYWEVDYAYLEDRDGVRDRSYHNFGVGYSRRYGRWISNSTRVIVNAGQSTEGGPNTADGVLLLSENSLITAYPSTIIPYFNFFAGFDRPQKAAGVDLLRNTGILFESDGMTGYPTLDPSAQNTYGGAVGINILPTDFSQQLVLETAFLGVMGEAADRNAAGDQYGVGARYQLPLNNSVILRADAMYGFLRNSEDINGVRVELRRKF